MAFMEWTDDLSVQVVEIDRQHKRMITMINLLHNALKEGKGNNVMHKLLIELMDYAAYHFETEEKMMKETNYPQLEKHQREHKAFRKKVEELTKAHAKGEYLVSIELNEFLRNWLRSHIIGSDQQFAPHLTVHLKS